MACPNRGELSDYCIGKLPEDSLESVSRHLESCSACQATIASLGGEDTFLGKVKQIREAPNAEVAAPATRAKSAAAASAAGSQAAGSQAATSTSKLHKQAAAAGASGIHTTSPAAAGASGIHKPSAAAAGASGVLSVTVSAAEFLQGVRDAELVDAAELSTVISRLPSDKREEPTAVARALVEGDKLTRFQAQAVLQGKAKGLRFGDYVVIDRIGSGGMGHVYKARHRRMDRVVALKVITAASLKNADAVNRFQREVRAAAKLLHPNIVTAFDAGDQEGVHYLVMEFVDGPDMASLVKKQGRLAPATAMDYIGQVARGLAFAHSKGIVHRDIKPGNLLVGTDGTVKILDMGLARLDDASAAADAQAQAELTQSGQVMGTLDYMAPEQALNTSKADAKSDVYSLGCTLYRVLAGENVYGGTTVVEKILAHREQPIPSIRRLRSDVPPGIDMLIMRMVAKRPAERPTMTEVAEAIEAIKRGAPPAMAGPADFTLPPVAVAAPVMSAPSPTAPIYSIGGPTANTAAAPQVYGGGGRKKSGSGGGMKLAALAGGGALVMLGILIYIKNQKGDTIAVVNAPDGAQVEIVTTPGATATSTSTATPSATASPSVIVVTPPRVFSTGTAGAAPRIMVSTDQVFVTGSGGVITTNVPDAGTSTTVAAPPSSGPRDLTPAEIQSVQQAWASYLQVPVQVSVAGVDLRLIPPGNFLMGVSSPQLDAIVQMSIREGSKSTPDQIRGSYAPILTPRHLVVMNNPYLIGRTKVTIGQFRQFVDATKYVTETERAGGGRVKDQQNVRDPNLTWRAPGYPVTDDTPVTLVSWNDAVAYCNWLDQQLRAGGHAWAGRLTPIELPREAQWEHACRAGTTTMYWFGDDPAGLKQTDWSGADNVAGPQPVAQRQANPLGLFDLYGNVFEWCADAPRDYTAGPQGQGTSRLPDRRATRSGIWYRNGMHSAGRGHYQTTWEYDNLGFRVAASFKVSPGAGSPPLATIVPSSTPVATTATTTTTTTAVAPPPPPTAATFPQRAVAERMLSFGALLKVNDSNGVEVAARTLIQLPPGEFTVTEIEALNAGSFRDQDLEMVRSLKALRKLVIHKGQITGSGLAYLHGLPELNFIDLNGNPLGDVGLEYLATLPNLDIVGFVNTKVGDAGLKKLAAAKTLRSLNVDHTFVTDAGLVYVKELTNLTFINLDSDAITDAGVESLAALPNLGTVVLAYTQITDRCVPRLVQMTQLKNLNIRNTQLSAAAVAALKEQMPGTVVNYSALPLGYVPPTRPAPTAVAPSSPTDAAIVCTKLEAKSQAAGLAGGAVPFLGPPGVNRGGANGIVVNAPAGWEQAGTKWEFDYRYDTDSAQGVQVVHPMDGGHVRLNIWRDRIALSNGGQWVTLGGDVYANNSSAGGGMITNAAATVMPLQPNVAYRIATSGRPGGIVSVTVNGTTIKVSKVPTFQPQGMKPPFTDPNCPQTLGVGQAALIIGPVTTGLNSASSIRFSTAGPAPHFAGGGPPPSMQAAAPTTTPAAPSTAAIPRPNGSHVPWTSDTWPPASTRSEVTITGPFPFTAVPVEQLQTDPETFEQLFGGTALVLTQKRGNAQAERGVLECRINQDGVYYLAASWSFDGSLDDATKAEIADEDAIEDLGWTRIGRTKFVCPVLPPPTPYVMTNPEETMVYVKACKAGETLRIRTRKERPPMIVIPRPPVPITATAAASPSTTPAATGMTPGIQQPFMPVPFTIGGSGADTTSIRTGAGGGSTITASATGLADVLMLGPQQFTRSKASERFIAGQTPAYLEQAVALQLVQTKLKFNAVWGLADFRISRPGKLYMAVSWQSDGVMTPTEVAERWDEKRLVDEGWTKVEEKTVRLDLLPLGTAPLEETHKIYQRDCGQGDLFRIRTRKYHPPVLFVAPEEAATTPFAGIVPTAPTVARTTDPTLIVGNLESAQPPSDVVAGAIPFRGPKGDRGDGANGIAVDTPHDYKTQGTVWRMNFSTEGEAEGISIVHPFGTGHVRAQLLRTRVDLFINGTWGSGTKVYTSGSSYPKSSNSLASKVFPLTQNLPHVLVSKLDAAGNYELTVDGVWVARAKIATPKALKMIPPFLDTAVPPTLNAGQAALVVGSTFDQTNRVSEARLEPATGNGATSTSSITTPAPVTAATTTRSPTTAAPPSIAVSQRAIAERTVAGGGRVRVRTPDGTTKSVSSVVELPPGDFDVIDVSVSSGQNVTDADLQVFGTLAKLERLYISNSRIAGPGLAYIKDLQQMTSLTIDRCPLGDAGLDHIANLKTLTFLSLGYTQVTDAGLQKLAGMPDLRSIHLQNSRITTAGMTHLATISNLDNINVDQLPITDDGIDVLKKLTQLRTLALRGTKVTNLCVQTLAQIKTLRTIYLDGTAVSPQALTFLRQQLPQARVTPL